MRLKEWGGTKMEDVKDLLGRLLNRVDGSGISDEDLNRQINAIYSIDLADRNRSSCRRAGSTL